MTQPAKSQEPSMEEILASIRRIIADDDAHKAQTPPEPTKPAAAAATPAALTAPVSPRAAAPPPPPPPPPRPSALTREPLASAAPLPAGAPSAVHDPADILNLTESMTAAPRAAEPAAPPAFRTIDGNSDIFFSDEPEQAANPDSEMESRVPARPFERDLMSSATSAAVDSAFNTLAQTVLVQNARTLEDLVREMLRPMLRSWLDDNLPGMVERLVRAEIERVSRGRPG